MIFSLYGVGTLGPQGLHTSLYVHFLSIQPLLYAVVNSTECTSPAYPSTAVYNNWRTMWWKVPHSGGAFCKQCHLTILHCSYKLQYIDAGAWYAIIWPCGELKMINIMFYCLITLEGNKNMSNILLPP